MSIQPDGIISSGSSGGMTLAGVQSASFTAQGNYDYPVNTTSNAITMTLPAIPSAGQKIRVTDYAGTFATNNLTINGNGAKISGNSNNAVLNINDISFSLTYVDGTQGWLPDTYSVWGSAFPRFALVGDALTASALSTNLVWFNAAAAGSVVEITAAEYANLIAITATSTIGASTAQMALTAEQGSNGNDYITAYNIAVPAGAKFVGFTIKIWAASRFQIYSCNGNTGLPVATRRYDTLSSVGTGQKYFAIKTPGTEALSYVGINNIGANNGAARNSAMPINSVAFAVPPSASPKTMTNAYTGVRGPLLQILNRTT
jgi:hypothetical protein